MLELTQANFATEVENFNGVVIVDFWAPWCGPCRMIAPLFEELSTEYANNPQIKFCKINTDEEGEIAAKFKIRGIPTLKVFKGGKEVEQFVGAAPKEVYKELIGRHLAI